ncbi:hypothetical protein GTP38_23360 [Duganella sp. FT94W]|uniref:Uncharacterized protein n=1 Tax=Duganella lactea TaxID=2692173 RepID=A0ABW9VF69_9BURK|nr:hypothetical protein [Duganella lactea]MYM37269.1 hypothetical protein [Duganella lactea]
MATMYYRPGVTSWNTGSAGSWSNTSGGANNGLVPDATTDVVFDFRSAPTCDLVNASDGGGSMVRCKSITTIGWGGNFGASIGDGLDVRGDADLSGVNSYGAGRLQLSGTGTFKPWRSAGANVAIYAAAQPGVVITMGADLYLASGLTIGYDASCVFNANGFNITARNISINGVANMGSGMWTVTESSQGAQTFSVATGATINAGTSTLKFSNAVGPTIRLYFNGGGKSFNNVWVDYPGGATLQINDSGNTFSDLKVSAGAAVGFLGGVALTLGSLTSLGNPAQKITLRGTPSSPSQYTINKSGGSVGYIDYADISWLNASPGSWLARSSANSGNNTGITFVPGNSNFISFM